MRLGFASPVSLRLLSDLLPDAGELPFGHEFSPAAAWIRELVRRGHHVTVYSTTRDISRPQTFRGERLTLRLVPLRSVGAARDFFAQERRDLKAMMAEDACDVIHAHWTYEFALAALATGKPTLITVHDLPWNVLRYFRDKFRVARLMMAYQVALRGKHFTAVSQDAARHFRHYLCPWRRIDVVSNGLADELFHRPTSSARGTRAFTFGTVLQGWSRRKNASTALRAFAQLRRTHPEVRLVMFGRDYEPGGVAERWATDEGLLDGVLFAGLLPYAELMRRLESEIDVLVHPSLDESFSLAAVEAMAVHKPVIAGASTPGVREVLGYGEAGVLLNVRDPAALMNGMKSLVDDPEKCRQIGEQGYQRAFAKYRTGASVDLYEQLYRRIANSS